MIGRFRSEYHLVLLAAQFLTRLPLPPLEDYSEEKQAASVRHHPLIGYLIGGLAATVFGVSLLIFPPMIAVIISIACTLVLTGGFHEDGLADTFDGIGGGMTADRTLEIMKDSRIGSYGALALIMIITLKIVALSAMDVSVVALSLIVGQAISRWSALLIMATSQYVRPIGIAQALTKAMDAGSLIYPSIMALLGVMLIGVVLSPVIALGGLAGLLIGHVLIRQMFERQIGGYTGDCLGATQQVSEVGFYLGILACL